MKKTNKKGFTLVELLVVIAIIAILSVVSIVGYTSFTQRAKESNAKTELAQATTYIYAAADQNAQISVTSDAVLVSFKDAFTGENKEAEAEKAALKVIRDAMGKDAGDTFANRIILDSTAVQLTADKVVSISKIVYEKTSDNVYATWTVKDNVVEAKSGTPTNRVSEAYTYSEAA